MIMTPATSFVVNVNRNATSDARFDMRLTNEFDDEDATSAGWAWVAAILIAGTLIVSGYLEQESVNPRAQSVSVMTEKNAANTPAAQLVKASLRVADKGY
jgi:hypothetical protein